MSHTNTNLNASVDSPRAVTGNESDAPFAGLLDHLHGFVAEAIEEVAEIVLQHVFPEQHAEYMMQHAENMRRREEISLARQRAEEELARARDALAEAQDALRHFKSMHADYDLDREDQLLKKMEGHEHMIREQLEGSKARWADDRAWVEQVQIDLNDPSMTSLEDQARLSEIRFYLCEERAAVVGPLLSDASSLRAHAVLGPRFEACMQSVDDVYSPTILKIDALLRGDEDAAGGNAE